MNILVTMPKGEVRDTFFTDKSISSLEALGNVKYNPHNREYSIDELKEELKCIDIVFCCWGSAAYDEELLSSAPHLKIIAYCAGTVSGVATPAVYKNGIAMLSANCVFAESVAESCICYSMVGLRRIENYANDVRNGLWRGKIFYNEGIMDRTVGIIGFGAIAKKFVGFLKPFRCNVLVYSSHMTQEEADNYGVKIASLEDVFAKSDIVSVHSGLNERTRHMIKREHLDLMKDGSLLINTARGAVIDEAALIDVLKTGRINAVLDVLEEEPPALDSPFRTLKNVTVLPHMGGPTIDRRQYCVIKLVDDIKKLMSGEKKETLETYIPESHIANMTTEAQKFNMIFAPLFCCVTCFYKLFLYSLGDRPVCFLKRRLK